MIAYVFWHWKKHDISTKEYENRLQQFHAALASAPPDGFIRSLSVACSGLPWTTSDEVYEDWYLIEGFGALHLLNEGAVSSSRLQPHNAVAAATSDGAGGIYAFRQGEALLQPMHTYWFAKPSGMPYSECFARLAPLAEETRSGLWIRQMVLGPAREFCLQAEKSLSLPPGFEVLRVSLRRVWSGP